MKSFLSVWRSRNNMKSPDKISTWLEPSQVNVFYLSIVQPTEMSQLNMIKGRSWLYESEVCDDNWPCCPATCWLCVSQLSHFTKRIYSKLGSRKILENLKSTFDFWINSCSNVQRYQNSLKGADRWRGWKELKVENSTVLFFPLQWGRISQRDCPLSTVSDFNVLFLVFMIFIVIIMIKQENILGYIYRLRLTQLLEISWC